MISRIFLLLLSSMMMILVASCTNSEQPSSFERPIDYAGYYKSPTNGHTFPESANEKELPELAMSLKTIVISPEMDCKNWDCMGVNDPENERIIFSVGDYTHLGPLVIQANGKPDKRRVLVKDMPSENHPCNEEVANQVIIESFDFWGNNNILHGLTIRGHSKQKGDIIGGKTSRFLPGSTGNVVDYCVIEGVAGTAIRMYGKDQTVQNTVIRNKAEGVGSDAGGINIVARKGEVSDGLHVVNCEIYNVTDCLGMSIEGGDGGEVKNIVFENNDLYQDYPIKIDEFGRETNCAENLADFKNGPNLPDNRTLFINNRLWGSRATDQSCGGSGSSGAAVEIQMNCKNFVARGNIIFNVPAAFNIRKGDGGENIALLNNLIDSLPNTSKNELLSGYAFRVTIPSADIYYNTIRNANRLFILQANKTIINAQCNMILDVDRLENNDNGTWSMNIENDTDEYLEDMKVYIKRWTGPELKTFRNILPSNQRGPFIQPLTNTQHCGPGGSGDRWWAK